MTEATEHPKKTTPRPHPMAFRRETACARCGTDWFRPGVLFDRDATELQYVTMCATCGATAPKYDTVTAAPQAPLSETRLQEIAGQINRAHTGATLRDAIDAARTPSRGEDNG